MPSESAKKRQAQKRDKRQAAGKKKKPVAQQSDKDDTEQQDIEEKDTAKDEGEQEPEDIDDDCQTPERAASGASIESEVSSELAAVKLTVRSCTGSWIIEKHVLFPHPVHRCPLTLMYSTRDGGVRIEVSHVLDRAYARTVYVAYWASVRY